MAVSRRHSTRPCCPAAGQYRQRHFLRSADDHAKCHRRRGRPHHPAGRRQREIRPTTGTAPRISQQPRRTRHQHSTNRKNGRAAECHRSATRRNRIRSQPAACALEFPLRGHLRTRSQQGVFYQCASPAGHHQRERPLHVPCLHRARSKDRSRFTRRHLSHHRHDDRGHRHLEPSSRRGHARL